MDEKFHSGGNEEKITQVSHFDDKQTYGASGLKRSLHGTVYQLKHLMLILHRAWKLGYPFRLSTEMIAAEKFDDSWASGRKNLDVLKYLVEKGANVNSQDTFGQTPIYQSCLHGDLDVIKYSLEAGADVNIPNMFRVTPLQYAATSGNWDVVRYLLANGANSDCLDQQSWTLLNEPNI